MVRKYLPLCTVFFAIGNCLGFTPLHEFGSHHTSNGMVKNRFMVSNASESSALPKRAATSSAAPRIGTAPSDSFLTEFFRSECDDSNIPPSLSIIMRSISELPSGSDIRGAFIDHPRLGSLGSVAHSISKSKLPALTPFAAHCFGYAFATMVKEMYPEGEEVVICIGRDPRTHGTTLADAFSRGAGGVQNVRVVYTGIASTPAMFEFCRSSLCDGGVMVTASHLPNDRNGFKFFTLQGGFSKSQIQTMANRAKKHSEMWYDMGTIPPTSGINAVYSSEWVNWMPHYELQLKHALMKQVHGDHEKHAVKQTLRGLKIVLNSGNGSGGFFRSVLEDLGADVSASINTVPDSNFPEGIPNPEYAPMIDATIKACETANADLGIMLDTDADRCGMVVPRTIGKDGSCTDYEPLNRNRLIALLGVVFSRESPACAIVTDSVTSNGLEKFLVDDLGLTHVRYLKGYANVINKARSLNSNDGINAQVAIETSGHCAMKENDFLDDGTYTAVKVIGLLARERIDHPTMSLLELISNLQEMQEVKELRMEAKDGLIDTMRRAFDYMALAVEEACVTNSDWELDKENLEGIRVTTGSDGGFFMIRKSLHDPIISLLVEATSVDAARKLVVSPLLQLVHSEEEVLSSLDISVLEEY